MFSKEEKDYITKEFWATLKSKSKAKLGKRHRWVLNRTGIKFIQLKFEVQRQSALAILQCYGASKEKREWIFDIIKQYHIVIDDTTQKTPEWDKEGSLPELGGMPSLYYRIFGVDYLQEKDWEVIHNFLIDRMQRLENAFLEIKDVLKVEIKELL